MDKDWIAIGISAVALVVAGWSQLTARRAAASAQQQADAAIGNLPPTLSLHQEATEFPFDNPEVSATITNFNRRPIFITSWTVEVDEGLVVYQSGSETTLEAVQNALRKGHRKFQPPLRIAGHNSSEAPPQQAWRFRISHPDDAPKSVLATVEVTVHFLMDGDQSTQHQLSASITADGPWPEILGGG
jgi:hypothetical protein